MCGAQPKVDNSIQEQMLEESRQARIREKRRQKRIERGTEKIDGVFGQFDDGFFNGVRDEQMAYYKPQLDSQFGDAKDALTFALARAGTLKSSMAADKQADLTTRYTDSLATMLSQAQGAADSQRARTNQEKGSLVSMLNATGDANRASNEALARTQTLYQERPGYNPIGDVFAGAAQGIGQYLNLQNQQAMWNQYNSGSTSASVIGG